MAKASRASQFVMESDEVESMARESGVSVLELLPSLVKSAKMLARPPISNYQVGAVGLGSDGRIFFGVNLEFPGLPLNHSVHAEQFLITNAGLNGSARIEYIAVSSAPCGHCRQFLQEIRGGSEIKIRITSEENQNPSQTSQLGELAFSPLSHFLPHRFGPDDLLDKDVPLLLEPHHYGLFLAETDKNRHCCNGFGAGSFEELKRAALEAANRAHAPYSGCPSGVSIVDSRGRIFSGSYAESAAYNPSLGPLQAALVAYVAGGGSYDQIVGAVLVEKEAAVVGQESTARLLLESISPGCDFIVFRCPTKEEC
ncbi:cytidine deaminase 1-like [Tasmannia lanceolata]|uniref:cytidine deaminase 1-like n=1 Tax=Tasmannia lanceolata TaxID=3420 RepID=UPI004064157E